MTGVWHTPVRTIRLEHNPHVPPLEYSQIWKRFGIRISEILCQWVSDLAKTTDVNKLTPTPLLRGVFIHRKPKKRIRHPQMSHPYVPPRRAHGTLQTAWLKVS